MIKEKVKEFFIENKNNEIIIICIGTDANIGDCLAPLVGTLLKEKGIKNTVYGDLENPIHALNLIKKIDEIKLKHQNSKIIAIDACLSYDSEPGKILFDYKPISPGAGVDKKLPKVGDVSIKGIIGSSDVPFFNNNFRLGLVYKMASKITNILIESSEV